MDDRKRNTDNAGQHPVETNVLAADEHGRWVSVDVLRAIAVLWVVVFHLWADMGGAFAPLYAGFPERLTSSVPHALSGVGELVASCGYQGVVVFMILSGFALTVNAERRGSATLGARATAMRVRKLLIPYWGAVFLLLGTIGTIAVVSAYRHGQSFEDAWFDVSLAKSVPTNVHFDDVLWALSVFGWALRDTAFTFPIGSLWFVQLMLQYYLLFPIAYLALKRMGPARFMLAAVAVTFLVRAALFFPPLSLMEPRHSSRILLFFSGARFIEFALGMALGLVCVSDGIQLRKLLRPWWIVVSLLGAILATEIFVRGWLTDTEWGGWPVTLQWHVMFADPLIAAALLAFVAIWLVNFPASQATNIGARMLAAIGVVSYTVLIANDNVRYVASFLRREELATPLWWLFVTVVYVPASVLLAFPLARLFRLTRSTQRRADERGSRAAQAGRSTDYHPSPGLDEAHERAV